MQATRLREATQIRRAGVREQFEAGASGLETSLALRQIVDSTIGELRQARLAELPSNERQRVEQGLAFVAVGGYGRGDLAPFSDVDLLLLKADDADEVVEQFAKKAVRDVWDAGFKLGHASATTAEYLKLARAETITATSLMEARLLFGPESLFDDLQTRFETLLRRGGASRWCKRIIETALADRDKYGSTVHLLEPDLKRSKGGLRDLHLVRWLGKVLHNTADWKLLETLGVLGAGDADVLQLGHDFLLRLRHALHFHAGGLNDSLTRAEQVRLAAERGYVATDSLLPVEQFMRDYFQHATAVADVVDRFLEGVQPRSMVQGVGGMVLSRRLDRGLWLKSRKIICSQKTLQRHVKSLNDTLALIRLAANHDADLDRGVVEELRRNYNHVGTPAGDDVWVAHEDVREFMLILGQPGKLHRLLRGMHQSGVLRRLLPEFEHARCLLQFNAYHKYTVDEHTFFMLGFAEDLLNSSDLLGSEYRKVKRKDLLHLAILLHDLGKGREEDHSEVGGRIAEKVADRFGLPEHDRRVLVFLVRQHLYLSQMAFHRDSDDPGLWLQVARTAESAALLRMLFVLTAVDIMAVGPGTFNRWKSDLLCGLYRNSMRLLGEPIDDADQPEEWERLRTSIRELLADDPRAATFAESLPIAYLRETPLDVASRDLEQWLRSAENAVQTRAEFDPDSRTVTYTVTASERLVDGVFHKICGGLAAHHLQIHSARIHTLADGTAIDRFQITDPHQSGPPAPDRVAKIADTLRRILTSELAVSDALWSCRSSRFLRRKARLATQQPRAAVDNDCSDEFTVIDVFAGDHRGLLYTLAKGIFRLGLSVRYAKIATYAEEGVDVFYVQEADGKKVCRDDRIQQIRRHLLRDIETLSSDPRAMGF